MAATEFKGDETQRELLKDYGEQYVRQNEVLVTALRSITGTQSNDASSQEIEITKTAKKYISD